MPDSEEVTTRDRILRAASELFAERGFHTTTTREIAEIVGIRQPGLFHHFSSKNEIMSTLQEIDFAASRTAIETATGLDESPAVVLGVALRLDLDRLVGSPYVMVATVQPAVFNDPTFATGRKRYEETVRLQSDLIRAGVDAGDFVDADPGFAAAALEWMIDGMLIDAWRRRESVAADRLVDELLRFALRSLLRDPSVLDSVVDRVHVCVEDLVD